MRGKGRWDERGGVTEEEEWSGGKGERERERGKLYISARAGT